MGQHEEDRAEGRFAMLVILLLLAITAIAAVVGGAYGLWS